MIIECLELVFFIGGTRKVKTFLRNRFSQTAVTFLREICSESSVEVKLVP